jgi:septal ring factor EnvC (AmiA/AmiB activator)
MKMENIENLLLEHLKAIRADVALIKSDLKEQTHRLGRLEVSMSGLRRDMAFVDGTAAEQSVRMDRMSDRIERIERRLELA